MAEKAKEKVKAVREKSSGFRKEFIEFISRGSVVDLAVGVAVGGAFNEIVKSLVDNIIMPIVGLISGGIDFTKLIITVPRWIGEGPAAEIKIGLFIQSVLQFLIIAWVIFMMIKVINRINRLKERKFGKKEAEDKAEAGDEKKSEEKKSTKK